MIIGFSWARESEQEVEVGVLGNEDVHTSVVGALVKEEQFYDYEAKYLDNIVTLQIPAELPEEVSTNFANMTFACFYCY